MKFWPPHRLRELATGLREKSPGGKPEAFVSVAEVLEAVAGDVERLEAENEGLRAATSGFGIARVAFDDNAREAAKAERYRMALVALLKTCQAGMTDEDGFDAERLAGAMDAADEALKATTA